MLKTFKNRIEKKFSNARGSLTVQWNETPDEDVEICIFEQIGKEPWEDNGITTSDFKEALDTIPKGRGMHMLINSPGGSVHHGMGIKTLCDEFKGKKTATVIGIAASTMSWVPMSFDEIRMPKGAQMFIHEPFAQIEGNADNIMREAEHVRDQLNKTAGQIAGIYARKTKKPIEEMRQLMKEETLLTGQECKDLGLIDTLTDDKPISNFTDDALAAMKNRLAVMRNSVAKSGAGNQQNTTHIMDKTKMLALLNKWGVTPPANATDEQITALVENGPPVKAPENKVELDTLKNQILQLTTLSNDAKRRDISSKIAQLVIEDKVLEGEKNAEIEFCLADEKRLTVLSNRTPRAPGSDPVPAVLDGVTESPKETLRGFSKFSDVSKAYIAGTADGKALASSSKDRTRFVQKNQKALDLIMNAGHGLGRIMNTTNTIATQVQRQYIMAGMVLTDFVRILTDLSLFSTVFRDVPLEGTHKMDIPFFDLDATASRSFNGTYTADDTTTSYKELTIGYADGGGGKGVGYDRAYLGLSFTSQDFARQPYLKIQELAQLRAQKLAYDVWIDILSLVTKTNFTTKGLVIPAAAATAKDLAKMVLACKKMPRGMGRTLMVSTDIHAALLADPAFMYALNAASDAAIKEGKLNPRVMGFDYVENPVLTDCTPYTSEGLIGFAVFKSAILVGFAPVPPVEEVRAAGTTYEMFLDPQTNAGFEYRTFGANSTDTATHIIECNYGFAKGVASALVPWNEK